MKFTITAKLFAGFGVLLALVIGIGVYSLSVNQNALEESVGQGSVFIVEDMVQRIDKDIFFKIEDLVKFASDPSTQQERRLSNQAFAELEDVDAYIREQDALWAAAPPGETTSLMEERINNPSAGCLRDVFARFGELGYGYQNYSEVLATNAYGANVAQSARTASLHQTNEIWRQDAKASGFVAGTASSG